MTMRALAVAVGGGSAALAVVWSMFAPAEVTRTDVESGTLAQVAQTSTDHLECGGGLRAEVGAAQSCTLSRGSDKYPVTLRVTAVDGTNVRWDSVVASDPQGGRRVAARELETHTRDVLVKQRTVGSVKCDGALPGAVGATQTCSVSGPGADRRVRTTVTAVDPGRVQWSVTALR